MKAMWLPLALSAAYLIDHALGLGQDVVMAIGPLALAGIGAATGLLKSELVDRPAAERQRKLRATEIALSPFTGLKPMTEVKEASPLESALAYGSTGANIGSGIEELDIKRQGQRSLFEYLKNQQQPGIAASALDPTRIG